VTLADVLAQTRHVLLDFDGPMCATFSAISAADATQQLGDLPLAGTLLLPHSDLVPLLNDPVVKTALDPLLLEHRSRIFREHFRDPMEL